MLVAMLTHHVKTEMLYTYSISALIYEFIHLNFSMSGYGYAIVAGILGIVTFYLYWSKQKTAAKMAAKIKKLRDTANSWDAETTIFDFDPSTKLTDSSFDDMKGMFFFFLQTTSTELFINSIHVIRTYCKNYTPKQL